VKDHIPGKIHDDLTSDSFPILAGLIAHEDPVPFGRGQHAQRIVQRKAKTPNKGRSIPGLDQ
tara:strand:+ start:523 stop:708 length:186 start_codon:yes stop_codon:yes gene_type:complete